MPTETIKKNAGPRKEPHTDNNKSINGYTAKIIDIPETHKNAGDIPFDDMNRPDDFEETENPINGADHSDPATGKTLEHYENYRITKEKVIPKSKPTILIGGSPVAAAGNITGITAESKGGKTALMNALAAAALSPSGELQDFEGMKVEPNINGWADIVIDTEQSEEDQQYNVCQNLRRVGLPSTPDHYQAYNIRVMPLAEYQEFVTILFEECYKKFVGIHLAIIDGGADFNPTGVNDEAEAISNVAFFISLAVKYHCAIFIVVHLNENAGKNADTMPRGHYGRQVVRKGYAQLNITKKGDISTLQVLRARKAGIDTPLINYKYCIERGYHVTVDGESRDDKAAAKHSAEKETILELAKKVLAPPLALTHTELIKAIGKAIDKSQGTAKRRKEAMLFYEFISHNVTDKRYRLIV